VYHTEAEINKFRSFVDANEPKVNRISGSTKRKRSNIAKVPPVSETTKRQSMVNFTVSTGLIIDDVQPFALINAEFSGKIFGFGINLFTESEDHILSGNVIINFFRRDRRVVPFSTLGLGGCKHDYLFVNIGGGIKIRFKNHYGLRAEYREWSTFDAIFQSIAIGLFIE